MAENKTATVILLSYKREQNIQAIAKTILECGFVSKLIISNNNPEVDIHQHVHLADKRLEIITQPEERGCGVRWEIVRDCEAEYVIAVDDDVFPTTKQLAKLFSELLFEPECPHGVFGSRIFEEDGRLKTTFHGVCDKPVDVIHNLYAVTGEQVKRYFEIREFLLNKEPELVPYVDRYVDDVVISHSGQTRPMLNNIGFLQECETHGAEGVACKADKDFLQRRDRVYRALAEIRQQRDA